MSRNNPSFDSQNAFVPLRKVTESFIPKAVMENGKTKVQDDNNIDQGNSIASATSLSELSALDAPADESQEEKEDPVATIDDSSDPPDYESDDFESIKYH